MSLEDIDLLFGGARALGTLPNDITEKTVHTQVEDVTGSGKNATASETSAGVVSEEKV